MDFVPVDRQIPLRGTPAVGLVDVGFGKLYILEKAGGDWRLGLRSYDK